MKKKSFIVVALIGVMTLVSSCAGQWNYDAMIADCETFMDNGELDKALKLYDKLIELKTNLTDAQTDALVALQKNDHFVELGREPLEEDGYTDPQMNYNSDELLFDDDFFDEFDE